MKKTDYSVSLRDGVRKRLKQYPRLLSQSLTASLLLLMLMWHNPAQSQGNCSLSCHGAQISLGFDCTAEVLVSMIADTSQCTGGGFVVYVITLANDTLPNATVTEAEIGTTLIASVVDTITGNSCWHYITVQDKWRPSITCVNDTMSCLEFLAFPGPLAVDNCDPSPDVILLNEVSTLLCDTLYIRRIDRTYIARDASGNESLPCTISILLERIDFSLIEFPDPLTIALGTALECDVPFADADNDGIPDPLDDPPFLGTGVPTINGIPIYPEFIGSCNALVTYEDVVLPQIGCVRKIMRIWTVREWHCTGEQDTVYQQMIEIVDTEGPVITCPANFVQTTTGHFCTATILLPPALIVDACSPTTTATVAYPGGFSPTNGGVWVSLPVGPNLITYTAYDQCFNSSTCTMTITVQDLTPPIAICDAHTVVSLTLGGQNGLTKVLASVFDDGSYDACGPVTFMARRMTSCINFDWTTNGAGIDEIPNNILTSEDEGTVFRPKVPFACCDAGAGPIMIQLEVSDASGNVNYCMVEVIVQDKIPPIIFCPSDITISCDYPVNVDDLDEFGSIVVGSSHTSPFCIYDPTNDDANISGFVCGQGGYVIDNCGVEVEETDFPFLNQCGVGYIVRRFTASDANGAVTCDQIITVENFDPITTLSIIWPLDYHGVECSEGTDPDDLPPPYDRPIINEDHCDLVGINYEDQVFEISAGACYKILRTWSIIEWCLYGELGRLALDTNYWTHVQIIKVVNSFGPEFQTTQPTIDQCNDFDCDGLFIELIQTADDDCTADNFLEACWAVDLNNNGTIDIGPFCSFGNTINASQTFPLGFHRVIYSFEDRCGNRTVREQLLNLRSCKAPTPVCINGLSTDLMPVDTDGDGHADNGMIVIWASDFDASSYHPCGFPFVLSLAPDISVTSLTFTCADVGAPVPVNLYVTDAQGNQAYCSTYIIIQDNLGSCPEGGNLLGTITGNVSTETSENVLDVKVQVDGSTMLPISTNQSGTYTFPSMPLGGNYVVEPDKNNDFKNGVSTLDLIHIQKHLLGIKELESPYKMIAADANNSKTITAIDLIELRKLILGIYTALPSNTSWRFVDKDYSFPDPYNPWEQVWPESVVLNPLSLGMNHADFLGVKIGDVNNTVKANAQTVVVRGAGDLLQLVIDDRQAATGETFEVPVYAGTSNNLEGMQFTLDLDGGLEVIDVKAGILDVTSDNFGWLDNHKLSSSWNKAEGTVVDPASPLFTLVLHALNTARLSQSISITSTPTTPEAYSSDNEIMDLGLKFRGADIYSFELLQNEPNPFNGTTQIGYVIPTNGEVTLTLFDVAGKQLYNETVLGVKGLNKIEINKEQIGAQGLVYYQVQFQGFTATKKMLIL
ncbi:MAG TPA: HYR domain-containing protein [Saprospiraceae bacterium]|nr:HYR domain-containing protein [Saprospiraceae bacterium]